MKVSVFTDASVQPTTRKAGFAFYIGCKTGKLMKAGKLKTATSDALIAELHCIANALHTLKLSQFTGITKVWLFSDSAMSVDILSGTAREFSDKKKRVVVREIEFLMIEICMKNGFSLRDVHAFFTIKHIKAHTGKGDRYSRINAWCDRNAKEYTKSRPTRLKAA